MQSIIMLFLKNYQGRGCFKKITPTKLRAVRVRCKQHEILPGIPTVTYEIQVVKGGMDQALRDG